MTIQLLGTLLGSPFSCVPKQSSLSLLQHKYTKTRRTGPILCIVDLPLELILEIIDHLPLVSQACLVLTCKAFLSSLGFILTAPELRFPHNINDDDVYAMVKMPAYPRKKLLRILQNDRWRYCSRCLKLHPTKEFSLLSQITPWQKRYCIFGPNAGIVNLCPCRSLTFRDKLHLVGHLKNLDCSKRYCFNPDDGQPRVWHECSYTQQSIRLGIKIVPALLDNGDLLISIQYEIGYEIKSPRSPTEILRIYCCPHRPTTFFDIWYIERDPSRFVCLTCSTTVNSYKVSYHGLDRRELFKAVRNLGNSISRPDSAWRAQTNILYNSLHKVR